MDNSGVNQSGLPISNTKNISIISLDIVPKYSTKLPNISSVTSSKTKTRKMPQLKTHMKLQSQYKAFTLS